MDPREQESLQRSVLKLVFPRYSSAAAKAFQHRNFGGVSFSEDPVYYVPAANWRSAKVVEAQGLKRDSPLTPVQEAATLEQTVPAEALVEEGPPPPKRSRGATVFDG